MADHDAAHGSSRERLLHAIHHLEHVLPGQAPLEDFVHHNTLHGYQHLPFPQALTRARQVTGIYGYLSPESFRQFLAEGRITIAELKAVLAEDALLAAHESLGPCSREEVYLAALRHDLSPVTPSRLAWQMEVGGRLDSLAIGVDGARKERFLTRARDAGRGEAQALEALWQGCLEVLDLTHAPGHVEELLDLDADRVRELRARLPGEEDREWPDWGREAVKKEGERLHALLLEETGSRLTLRGVLLSLTGHDILAEVQPYLVRQLAAFLDQGMTPWPLPERERGFYPAWRQAALADPGYLLEDLPDWRETLTHLPDDALAAVETLLSLLGLDSSRWGDYLERLAMELPGWAGMFLWRSQHPGYQGLDPKRVDVTDYLAVRLTLERLAALRLCRAQWRLDARLELLGWHFRHYPAELVLRWHLFQGQMPEHLASRVQILLRQAEENPAGEEEWQGLARQFLTWRLVRTGLEMEGFSVSRHAWRLFLLAQHLGLSGEEMVAGGRGLALNLLETLHRLDEEKAGYVWLVAYERHYRDAVLAAIAANRGRGRWATRESVPRGQLVFCMDDREEGIRRHLEEVAPDLETLGAAGFFGVAMNWQGLDEVRFSALCPVVVTPSHQVRERPREDAAELAHAHARRLRARQTLGDRILRYSHRGVVSPFLLNFFAAPGALGWLLAKVLAPRWSGRLLAGLRQKVDGSVPTRIAFAAPADAAPATPEAPRAGFTDAEQAARVEGMLRTLGLTSGFAELVVIMGHGSGSQNNPHLAAYDCGACSGRHGGPNARLFAAMANRPEVREILAGRGIVAPRETWFLGAEHHTGDETLSWYDLDLMPPEKADAFQALAASLERARAASAHERCRRLASAPRHASPEQALAHVQGRALDFAQARPELGHVTNAAALIGRRSVTRGVFFDRRMFLISYDPTLDPEGRIVEGILLAAGPVGAGISLEYYFSTVDNQRFGCGTKVVHNVTGFFGVMEGAGSDLRTGLPKQMIEIHEAMRLLVIVEQKPEILTAICQRQPVVAELVMHAWIQLASLDPDTGGIQVFRPGAGWEAWQPPAVPLPEVDSSTAWYRGHAGPLAPALIRHSREVGHG